MRRSNFLIAALTAIITFAALSAFVQRPWHRGWRHHCYYDRYENNERGHALRDSVTNQ